MSADGFLVTRLKHWPFSNFRDPLQIFSISWFKSWTLKIGTKGGYFRFYGEVNRECIFLWTALDALFFSCLHVRMCFFGCISLARIFILRVAEFSLSSYRSSKYFLAVDLQLICPIVITRQMVLQELGRLFSVLANLTLSSNSLKVM